MPAPAETIAPHTSLEFMRRAGIATFIGCEPANVGPKTDAKPSLTAPDGKTAMQPKALWISVGGTIVVDFADGSVQGESFQVAAGIIYFAVSRIQGAGTTATGIKFLY